MSERGENQFYRLSVQYLVHTSTNRESWVWRVATLSDEESSTDNEPQNQEISETAETDANSKQYSDSACSELRDLCETDSD